MLGVVAVVTVAGAGRDVLVVGASAGADAQPAGDITSAQVGALTAQLVGNQIELARADLQNKDYRGAIAQAERALRLDADSSEAREVIAAAEAQLAALEQHAAAARAAYQRGDTEAATRALGQVLAIDPRHPAVGELTAALNQHFRRQAEEALRAVEQARTAASEAGASAQDAYGVAERMRAEGTALLRPRRVRGGDPALPAGARRVRARAPRRWKRRRGPRPRPARPPPPPPPPCRRPPWSPRRAGHARSGDPASRRHRAARRRGRGAPAASAAAPRTTRRSAGSSPSTPAPSRARTWPSSAR